MQTSYGFSGVLCFSKTNTNSHSHSAPALYLTTRAEARVGGNSCRQSFRATRTSSWMLTGIVKCFKAHPNAKRKRSKTCQNMPPQCSCLSMHKTVKVCEKLSHAKVSLKKHATPNQRIQYTPTTSSRKRVASKIAFYTEATCHFWEMFYPSISKCISFRFWLCWFQKCKTSALQVKHCSATVRHHLLV